MAGLFGKLPLGLFGGSSSSGGGSLDSLTKTLADIPDLASDLPALPGLGGGSPLDILDQQPPIDLFNENTPSDPVSVASESNNFEVSVLSGPEASRDSTIFDVNVLSYADDPQDSYPPVDLVLGRDDAMMTDVEILSGSYGSSGVVNVNAGPDIWKGGSPVHIDAFTDPDHPTDVNVEMQGTLLSPVTEGNLLGPVTSLVPLDPILG